MVGRILIMISVIINMPSRGATNLRTTKQRQVILEELQRTASHPTADELLARVRQRMPRVSLGTIYRNLELLAAMGVVRVIEGFGGQRRFDADTRPHSHIRCVRCGAVADLMLNTTATTMAEVRGATDYRVLEVRLVCTGLCPQCQHGEKTADTKQ